MRTATSKTALVVSAHAADFVWRAGGAIALHRLRGYAVTVICLSYGERGESAKLWRQEGMTLERVKGERRREAEAAADLLGVADIQFWDLGDYPLRLSEEALYRLVEVYRSTNPAFVLSHSSKDIYNHDHPAVTDFAQHARIIAQAHGHNPGQKVLGAPPMFLFEPHQPEQCDWKPTVLLDITSGGRRSAPRSRHGGPRTPVGILHSRRSAAWGASSTQLRKEHRLRRRLRERLPARGRDASSMSVVITNPCRLARETAMGFTAYGVATVHEAQGRTGLLAAFMRPIYTGAKIAGSAVTVSVPPADNLMLHVVVVPCQAETSWRQSASDTGYFGELLACSLAARGVLGLVIEAGVRDVAALTRMGSRSGRRRFRHRGR